MCGPGEPRPGADEVANVVFTVGDALGDALVRPGCVVVHLVLGQDCAQMALPEDQHAIQELRRRVPTRRSQIAFICGAWTAVRRILVPVAWKTASNVRPERETCVAEERPSASACRRRALSPAVRS
jgi:hypothetical protein